LYLRWFGNGQRGVQIFFCISGFLIASTSIKRWGSLAQMKAREFYFLRVARIAPLFLILLAILSVLHFAGLENFVVWKKVGGLGQALFSALTFRVNVHEAMLGYLPPNWDILWSLSVEEMFYLFFPIVCVFLGRTKFFFGILAAFIVLGPLGRTLFAQNNDVWQEYSYLGSMDAISFGVLTALLTSHFKFSRRILNWSFSLGTLLLIATLCFSRTLRLWGLNQVGLDMTVLAIGTCMIIVAASQSLWRAPRLLYPILKLGERSYEIYLTHMFVILVFFDFFQTLKKPLEIVPIFFIASIIASALLGEIVARFYSEPLNSLLRKKLKKRNVVREDARLQSVQLDQPSP
jgi:peptidoglycan/LPS O-acetylase OafA/YrhL